MTETLRISIWSGPRNISTAMMYSFAQRADTRVVDEPLYGYYLAQTNARDYHPGADEVLATQETDGPTVIEEIILGPCDRPILFLKSMTHHVEGLDWGFMQKLCNVMLIRQPSEVLTSYAKNVHDVSLRDTGFAEQIAIFDYLQSHGQRPPVLDAKEVLLNPRGVLGKLCDQIGIPFDEAMLTWPAGPRPEDGAWAKYWYHSIHRSTGFQQYKPKDEPLPEHLLPLLEVCRPLYDRLRELAITA